MHHKDIKYQKEREISMQYECNNLITEFIPGGLRLWVLLSNGWAFLLTPQKSWEKYISIPHCGFKLLNLCSDQKKKTSPMHLWH
jgi:hypothetical protein